MLYLLFRHLSQIPAISYSKTIAVAGRPVGRLKVGWFHGDYNATMWPQLIIWDGDQMIRVGQLGPSVAIIFYVYYLCDLVICHLCYNCQGFPYDF